MSGGRATTPQWSPAVPVEGGSPLPLARPGPSKLPRMHLVSLPLPGIGPGQPRTQLGGPPHVGGYRRDSKCNRTALISFIQPGRGGGVRTCRGDASKCVLSLGELEGDCELLSSSSRDSRSISLVVLRAAAVRASASAAVAVNSAFLAVNSAVFVANIASSLSNCS